MTPEKINKRLEAAEKALTEKGMVTPKAHFAVRYLSDTFSAWIEYKIPEGSHKTEFFHHGECPDIALAKMDAFIAEMPSAETLAQHDFMDALGKVIDQGRAIGIETEFMNPLSQTMRQLSENVITYRPAAPASEPMPF